MIDIKLDPEEAETILKLLRDPPPPSQNLINAFRRHRERMNQKRDWRDYLSQSSQVSTDSGFVNATSTGIMMRALLEGGTFNQRNSSKMFKTSLGELIADLEKLGGKCIMRSLTGDGEIDRLMYSWDTGCIVVDVEEKCTGVDFYAFTCNDDLANKLDKIISTHTKPLMSAGRVYVLTGQDNDMDAVPLGQAAVEFEPKNYQAQVVEDFNHVVADLRVPNPCGRLVVIHGTSGTGKTYLVRSLARLAEEAMFLMIPPEAVPHLGKPSFLTAMLNIKRRQSDDKPVILIIEDADTCLMKRTSENMNALSAILNFSDGIIGNMLDLRIVCTTNAVRQDLDDALIRAGRLCRHIEVPPLSLEQGLERLKELTGKEDAVLPSGRKTVTLTEIYKAANGYGWNAPPEKRAVGFASMRVSDKSLRRAMGR